MREWYKPWHDTGRDEHDVSCVKRRSSTPDGESVATREREGSDISIGVYAKYGPPLETVLLAADFGLPLLEMVRTCAVFHILRRQAYNVLL